MEFPREANIIASESCVDEPMTDVGSTVQTKGTASPPPNLMTIPTELRLQILREALTFSIPLQFIERDDNWKRHQRQLWRANTAILLCNKQIHSEALPELFSHNTFVFEPWNFTDVFPPWAFHKIQHLTIKLNLKTFRRFLTIELPPHSHLIRQCPLPLFRQLKTLTVCFDNRLAKLSGFALRRTGYLLAGFDGIFKTSAAEVLIKGVEDKYLAERILSDMFDRSPE